MEGHDLFLPPRTVLAKGKSEIDFYVDFLPKGVDTLINNFGINHLSWIGTTQNTDEQILSVNTMVPYWLVNALVRKGEECRVINIASITHRVPQRCTSLYAASKAALVQMTRVMARELAPKGWIINAFCPGKIEDTEMSRLTDAQVCELRGWSEAMADGYAKSMIPAGRYTNVKECAKMVLWMLKAPSYLNGAVIDFTGGA